MKLFKILHWTSLVVGLLGVLGILGAWYLQLTEQIEIYGLSQGHFLNYGLVLFLAAIWIMLGAFWHRGTGK